MKGKNNVRHFRGFDLNQLRAFRICEAFFAPSPTRARRTASSILLFFIAEARPGGYMARFKYLPNEKARQT